MLKQHVLDQLGDRPIASIRRSDIIRRCDAIEDKHGAAMADAVLRLLGRVMAWHASRSDDFHSPIVRGMARTNQRDRARSRILTDSELQQVWATAADAGTFGALIKFLLLTGARVNEAARMTRAELAGETWTLPAARNKAKVELERPLSVAARAVLAGLPQLAGDYVFTSDGVHPFGGFSRRKKPFDVRCGVSGWTIHDLRRTARSLMSRAGVSSDHAERCLGHVLPGVRGVYDRHRYQAEMLRAYEALAAQINRIVNPRNNVTALPSRG
jgi:integrase